MRTGPVNTSKCKDDDAKAKGKGTKAMSAKPLQAARETKGRGKGKTKSDLLYRMCDFAWYNPTHAVAAIVSACRTGASSRKDRLLRTSQSAL